MKALIVYGSKHGSTREIAERMSQVMSEEGLQAVIADANGPIKGPEGFDVVIVGSAIRMRSWLRSPVRYVRSNRAALMNKQVWLFSSGLQVRDPRSTCPKSLEKIEKAIGPREHRFFSGSLDPKNMSSIHRYVLKLPGLRRVFPTGDYRHWDEIDSWTKAIAMSVSADASSRASAFDAEPAKVQKPTRLVRGNKTLE